MLLIGLAKANVLKDESVRLANWLGEGYHGGMLFLAREPAKRCNPQRIMPDCKSVIVLAMGYDEMPLKRVILSPSTSLRVNSANELMHSGYLSVASLSQDDRNVLARYLLYKDYHKVMMEKLKAVAAELQQEYPDVQCKCYVDTGPVLEKAWGVRTGLGFIGKNTLLISPELGSQIALGVILCNWNLGWRGWACEHLPRAAAQKPRSDRTPNSNCFYCTACIDACPTKALVAPYVLDARKCISYKYFIEKVEGGCDICQDVCPYNK